MIDILRQYGPNFLSGTWLTIQLMVIAAILGFLLAVYSGLGLLPLGLIAAIVAINLVGDRLREVLDPRALK